MKGITVTHLVFGSLVVASLFVVIRWFVTSETTRVHLMTRMGSPGWDFTKSWASNFTVVGAVLGTILGASGVLPDKTQLFPKGSYSALNLLFGILIVLAPFAYLATQGPVRAHTRTGDTSKQLRGYVWSFLLTTIITLWAVLGELATIAFLLYEIRSGGSLPSSVTYLFAGVMAAAALLMLRYLWYGIPDTIRDQANVKYHQATMRFEMLAYGVSPPKDIEAPLPRWSLF